jgi:hypothetical protein
MDFGEVLGRAWRIIWKHKILWIFGIFAGCSRGGGGGAGNSGYRFSGTNPQGQIPQIPENDQFWSQLGNWIGTHWWVVFLFILAILVLALIAILLGTIGRIGLIKGTQKADGGAEHLGFAELWDESLPYFWRVFLLALIVGVLSFVLVLALILLGFGAAVITLGIGLICLIPLFCVLLIVLWFVGLVIQLAEVAIVVIALPILVTIVPAAIAFGLANAQATTPNWAPLIVGLVCCAVYFPFLLVLNGILTAYSQSAWTLTFLRLTKPTDNVKPVESPENPVVPAPNA